MKKYGRQIFVVIVVILIGFATCNEATAQTTPNCNYRTVYTALIGSNSHLMLPGQTSPDSVYFGDQINIPRPVAMCVGAPAAFSFIVGRDMPQGISGIARAISLNQFNPLLKKGLLVSKTDTLAVVFSGLPEQFTVNGKPDGLLLYKIILLIVGVLFIIVVISTIYFVNLKKQNAPAQQSIRLKAEKVEGLEFQVGRFPVGRTSNGSQDEED